MIHITESEKLEVNIIWKNSKNFKKTLYKKKNKCYDIKCACERKQVQSVFEKNGNILTIGA